MENLKVKIKKVHEDAIIPSYAHIGDAGLDLTAVDYYFDIEGNVVYHTGIAIEIPEGYVGLIFPRSSICKIDLSITDAVGVIDSNYRGEITAKFKPSLVFVPNDDTEFRGENQFDEHSGVIIPNDERIPIEPTIYKAGDRIAQLIILPYPKIEFEEVYELSETERGENGYGSSGR